MSLNFFTPVQDEVSHPELADSGGDASGLLDQPFFRGWTAGRLVNVHYRQGAVRNAQNNPGLAARKVDARFPQSAEFASCSGAGSLSSLSKLPQTALSSETLSAPLLRLTSGAADLTVEIEAALS